MTTKALTRDKGVIGISRDGLRVLRNVASLALSGYGAAITLPVSRETLTVLAVALKRLCADMTIVADWNSEGGARDSRRSSRSTCLPVAMRVVSLNADEVVIELTRSEIAVVSQCLAWAIREAGSRREFDSVLGFSEATATETLEQLHAIELRMLAEPTENVPSVRVSRQLLTSASCKAGSSRLDLFEIPCTLESSSGEKTRLIKIVAHAPAEGLALSWAYCQTVLPGGVPYEPGSFLRDVAANSLLLSEMAIWSASLHEEIAFSRGKAQNTFLRCLTKSPTSR